MKAENLTIAALRSVKFPADMSADIEKTEAWINGGKVGRCRAAQRVITLFRASEPPPAAPVVEPKAEVLDQAPAVPVTEAPPAMSTVTASPDGSTTVTVTVRPSSLPPAPVTEAVTVAAPAAPNDSVLKAVRGLYLQWKGGPYVCGNAFGYMNKIDELLKANGF